MTGVQTCALPICELRHRREIAALERKKAIATDNKIKAQERELLQHLIDLKRELLNVSRQLPPETRESLFREVVCTGIDERPLSEVLQLEGPPRPVGEILNQLDVDQCRRFQVSLVMSFLSVRSKILVNFSWSFLVLFILRHFLVVLSATCLSHFSLFQSIHEMNKAIHSFFSGIPFDFNEVEGEKGPSGMPFRRRSGPILKQSTLVFKKSQATQTESSSSGSEKYHVIKKIKTSHTSVQPARPATPLGQALGISDDEALNGPSPTNATIGEDPDSEVFEMDLEVEEAMAGDLGGQEREMI